MGTTTAQILVPSKVSETVDVKVRAPLFMISDFLLLFLLSATLFPFFLKSL